MESAQHSSPGLTRLCVLAVVAGAVTGFVGGGFRWCLDHLTRWRLDMLDWSAGLGVPGWFIPVAVTAAGATVGALVVRFVPESSGSGIQQVEAVERGEASPSPPRLIPAKFLGGLAAMGSGLVLGREGPTVHMGAVVGSETGRRAGLDDNDIRALQTSMSGAGLAVAFTAPVGGALFALEEVSRSFRMRVVLPTILGVAVAVACGRLILGDRPDFVVGAVAAPSIVLLPVFVIFGLLTGLVGIAYTKVTLGAIAAVRGIVRVPPIAKATIIGAIIGALLAIDAQAAGGGDGLAQSIFDGGIVLPAIAALLVVRFFAGPLSYAAGTPGGLFAPMLAIGALWGVLFAAGVDVLFPQADSSLRDAMVLAGMAALFGAVVRAPLTGLVLVMEMTATTTVAVPMLAATAMAVLVAHLASVPPIYDSLREQMLADHRRPPPPGPTTSAA
ncbi:ClC family H(+)/Cl(-) exchange transporter [Gordonia jinghuaiqii]|uniref:ClC family H(+)/Cl(-) exchange transporter n=1 Tax=Gordonia jinghuaiqii TaxID=2758710 RepID=A0A7D7LX89_9ACTN|nr:ClC family H(+)/Cl(-) exchange transporter [Gordonia jinghuaiqii]MCR5979158.1 ClC family H(+)/Cl(-) exchange transporter [Gordonia jinghuaiqii]QMT00956.1 ClC family H(+)/Cl(-) exchange transporter [Gordonia jinghuaiqii]